MHLLLAVWEGRLGLGEDPGHIIRKELAGWKIWSLSKPYSTEKTPPTPHFKVPTVSADLALCWHNSRCPGLVTEPNNE